MKRGKPDPGPSGSAPRALATALAKSHDVKAKVEACVDELATANEVVKGKIAQGVTTLAADQALADGETVEAQVQEVATDLHQVTDALAQGVDDHQQNASALAQSREALERSTAALASARVQERAATWRSLHDRLTELPNRALFDDRLAHGIAMAQRHGWTLAVMFLDLDRFKTINDEHGHAIGDIVLKEVARRLLTHARDEDTVCRNGGDEFLYLLINPQGRENIRRIAEQVSQGMALPIDLGEVKLVVTPSIGVAIYPEHGTGGDQLVRMADAAMYRAKARATGFEVFEQA